MLNHIKCEVIEAGGAPNRYAQEKRHLERWLFEQNEQGRQDAAQQKKKPFQIQYVAICKLVHILTPYSSQTLTRGSPRSSRAWSTND